MIDYSNKICEACSVDAPKATQSEIEDFLKNHNEWYLATDVEFPQLRREFKFNNFSTAQKFTNIISDLAEEEGHHPSILLEYGKVTISWWSHKIQSLHVNDFILSSKTEELYNSKFSGAPFPGARACLINTSLPPSFKDVITLSFANE